ncbi:MAG TPA: ATP-dependent zinc metalloprotease FtsH [Acidimicrobiales bacterium]|nr:ATP-dependent zinc metalloprotease FtsH [Acidimicrobiales bacterium]
MKKRLGRPLVLYLALAIVVLVIGAVWLRSGSSPKKISLDEFQRQIASGNVAEATLKDHDHVINGKLTDGTSYTVSFPQEYGDELTKQLTDANVKLNVDQQKESLWVSLLFTLLPVLLLFGLFLLLMNSMQGGNRVLNFGKAKAKQHGDTNVKVTFADVAGCDEAVEELQEIKEFLENPTRFQSMGAKIPKGVLLYGPPGTGKTLLARAVAGEAGVPFFSISGSDFVEMFVGVGASRVRDLFDQAKATAPAIVFVDEIDAVGRHRGAGLGGGHDEREQTLNQLLVEMDGFDPRSGVILIAATNRPDILDPALLRPGRFDRQIVVDRPDIAGRKEILEVHAKGKPLAEGVNLELLAKRTPGFTGADLANLMNEAALLSARRDLERIGMMQLDEAIDRVLAGPERRSRVMSEEEKRVIAFHEAGHALVAHVLPEGDDVHKVSIVARGRALGLTWFLPEDRYTHNKAQLRAQMASALGGRSSEELVFGEVTTGAANDIEKCTEIAKAMVTQYGMSSALGPRKFGHEQGEVFLGRDAAHQRDYSDDIAAQIDAEVNALIDRAHDEALAILVAHRDTLNALANALIDRETVEDVELAELFKDIGTWPGMDDLDPTPQPVDEPSSTIPLVIPVPRPVAVAPAETVHPKPWTRIGRAWRRAPRPGTTT